MGAPCLPGPHHGSNAFQGFVEINKISIGSTKVHLPFHKPARPVVRKFRACAKRKRKLPPDNHSYFTFTTFWLY